MIFECEEVHVVSDDGTVEALGVEWTEAKVWAEKTLATLAYGAAFAAFVAAVVAGFAGAAAGWRVAEFPTMMAGLFLATAVWLAWNSANYEGKRQQMLFHANGTVSTTKDGFWNTRLTDIANIEYVQLSQKKKDEDLPYTHGVRVIARRGRVIHIAKNLEPDDAAALAVMLTEARESMRYMPAIAQGAQERAMVW
ncbi:MAG: hypothetical protein F9K29_18285 [Hyphomicrobiaceae bacterium]|nr:MAG: hypothetical protein F9K29_18285 [Hyphomicrobiaceae bacterium]